MSSINSDSTYIRTFSEMPSADREFGEDAGWKRIQQNTFTRWVNEHLKVSNKQIGNLETDLSDGLRLLSLIEALSGKRIMKYNKRPTFRSQKLENVSVCLDFLGNEEGIKIVNIDSTDIIDCNLKLILGLVWMLILHYSITIPSWDTEGMTVEASTKKKGHEPTPKQKLLSWIQSRIPDLTVSNFTSDWNDGKAIGALVDAVAPGLCPDWQDWDTIKALENAVEAMQLAEEWLNVPQLIKPREMVNLNVDELSMMTYLSQYPNARTKPNAPLRPRTNPAKVRVYGPGVEPSGVIAGTPTKFTVETFSAGRGQVEAGVKNIMDGTEQTVDVRFNDDRNLTYTCSYTPPERGTYLVDVRFAGRDVSKSPFKVYVDELLLDATKCTASGPGIDGTPSAKPGQLTHFRVYTKDAGKGRLECFFYQPSSGQNPKPINVRESSIPSSGEYLCDYTPVEAGSHLVHVNFEGRPIPGSPFGVSVEGGIDVTEMFVTGRGVQPKGIRTLDRVDFTIHSPKPVPVSSFTARVINPNMGEEVCKVVSCTEVKPLTNGNLGDRYLPTAAQTKTAKVTDVSYEYSPKVDGKYRIEMYCEDSPLPRTPFFVSVGKYKESKIKAFGPGLEEGIAGSDATFTVDTNGETGALEFAIEGPSQTKILCTDNGDGSAEVSYVPHLPGEYAVHILCDKEDIPGSPFMPIIVSPPEGLHPDKVKVYGNGIDGSKVYLGEQNEFFVDATHASTRYKAANSVVPKVALLDSGYQSVPVKLQKYSPPDGADTVYRCNYVPKSVGKHLLSVTYAGVAVPKSPWKLQVQPPCHPEKVLIYGPCVKTCSAALGEVCDFTIDATLAGTGDIRVVLLDANQKPVLANLKEMPDQPGVYKVEFVANTRGLHTAKVYFGDREVLEKPIEINVEPALNASLIKVNELESNVLIGSASEILVDAKLVEQQLEQIGKGTVKCAVEYPTDKYGEAFVENKQDGTYVVYFNPKDEGVYKLDLSYDGVPLFPKPYEVLAQNGCDPSKVKAVGPGLHKGHVNQPCKFLVDTRKGGLGGLGLTIEGPSEAKMSCRDNRDGTCSVEYFPTEPGDYDIIVKFQDVPITGSPFLASIYEVVNVDNITVYGEGLEARNFRAGVPTKFTLDASRAGNGPLEVLLREVKTGKLCSEQPVIKRLSRDLLQKSDVRALGVNYSTISRTGHYSPRWSPIPTADDLSSANVYQVWVTPPNLTQSPLGSEFDMETKFGGEAIPALPSQKFKLLPPFEPSSVVVCGPGTGDKSVLASLPSHVIIDTRDAGRATLDVITEDPQGRHLPGYLREKHEDHFGADQGRGIYQYTYTPHAAGPHNVKVIYGGQPVPGSPCPVNAQPLGDSSKAIVLANFPRSPIRIRPRREQCFKVDARPLGSFDPSRDPGVTCLVLSTNQPTGPKLGQLIMAECVDVVDNHDGTFTVFLNFDRTGTFKVETNLGGRPIPGGNFEFLVEDPDEPEDGTYVLEYIKQVSQYAQFRTVEFCLPPLPESDLSEIRSEAQSTLMTAEVTSPTGKMGLPKITSNTDGTINLRYHPAEPGLHQIEIKYKNDPVQGSPYQFYVDSINDSNITAWGPGLSHGSSGEACNFTIVTKDAGAGGLSMTVEGPSKAEISCHDNKDGTCGVTYVPVQPGEYKVNVKFNDKHISGSPFTVKITGEGKKRAQLSVGSANEISLKIDEPDIKKLKASIRTPAGVEDACLLKVLPNGNIGVSFTPHETGEHTLNILKGLEPIKGSPFKIIVKPGDIGDASKVKLSGAGLKEAKTHATNTFRVDTKSAGYGGLSVSLEGPSRALIESKDKESGICDISYVVNQPGTYFLNIKFADNHVPGSPFKIEVKGKGSELIKGSIKSEQKAAENTKAGSKCELNLKLPDTDPLDLGAQVTAPNGTTEDCDIVPTADGRFSIKFTPRELGVHSVSVKYKGQHIQGSPFPFTVGEIKRADGGTGAHKVKAYGPGLVNAEVNLKAEFNVNTHEAGSGVLTVAIEGPGKSDIQYEDLKNGSCAIQYTCTEVGEYLVRVNFNDKPIPDSPFKVYVQPPMGEARKITTSSMEDHISAIGKPVTFNVNMNGTRGHLEAKAVSPSGQEDDCYIIPSGDDSYMVRFVPKVKGTHYVHVKFNNVHIRHSPFRFKVGKEVEGDPFKVQVSGKGLSSGAAGKPNEFFVNTTNSGAGILAVTVDGPSKVKVDSREEQEGYAINWTPQTPGSYYISVKFSGHHISGSPFKAVVEGRAPPKQSSDTRETSTFVVETVTKSSSTQKEVALPKFKSDASKVETRGIGLQKAFINKHNTFMVNCSKAGESFLLVGVYNPADGAPCENLNVKHEGDRSYSVTYEIETPGQYFVFVKWGDNHVQGSPFTIDVTGLDDK